MELEQIRDWVREASVIARRHYNTVEARRKPDRSFVTAADEEIEQLLRARIGAAYPHHGILGEEGRNRNTDSEYVWALDPIDGTGSFVHGLPIWGISVGLLQHGRPLLGTFYLPLLDEWYEVGRSGPALFNSTPIGVMHDDLLDSESWIAVPSNIHRRYHIDYPGKVKSLGSIAAYMCYVARGTAAGALLGWPKLWDVAAGLAILERAGGAAHLLQAYTPLDTRTMLEGQYPREPVIVGSPPALDLLHTRITMLPR